MKVFQYSTTDLNSSQKNYEICFDDLLMQEWNKAMENGAFKFKIDEKLPSKILPGKYNFYLQVTTFKIESLSKLFDLNIKNLLSKG